jgi:hypothetical protein
MAMLAAAIPFVIQGVGSIIAGQKERSAGYRQSAFKRVEAAQLEQQAGQVIAASQRDASEERKKTELIASRALAVASSSGGGAHDPTVANIIADIQGEGAYRQAVALYQGEEQARRLKMGATATLAEGQLLEQAGKDKQSVYDWEAAGAAARGASSLYSKYSDPNLKKTPASGVKL